MNCSNCGKQTTKINDYAVFCYHCQSWNIVGDFIETNRKQLDIFGKQYDLLFLSDHEKSSMGMFNLLKNAITVDISLPDEEQQATVLHEILEALNSTLHHIITLIILSMETNQPHLILALEIMPFLMS